MNPSTHQRPEQIDDAGDGVSRYIKVAMLLRHKISSGEWPIGTQLPTIDVLMEQYGAARVTVRQAAAILAAEGLVVSQRGKGTFVRGVPQGPDRDLKQAINDPMLDSPDLKIEILEKRNVKTLPPELAVDAKLADSYVFLKKIHRLHGRVFAHMEIYLDKEVFDAFPKGAEKKEKISRLLTKNGWDKRPGFIRQSMTVCPADYELARKLDYAFAAPIAKIKRWSFDENNRILMAGVYCYRGDNFVLEFDLPIELYVRHPSMVFPEIQND